MFATDILTKLQSEFDNFEFDADCVLSSTAPAVVRIAHDGMELNAYLATNTTLKVGESNGVHRHVFRMRKATFNFGEVARYCMDWFAETRRLRNANEAWAKLFLDTLGWKLRRCDASQLWQVGNPSFAENTWPELRRLESPVWFTGSWDWPEIDSAIANSDCMLAISIGPSPDGRCRVWIKRRINVDRLLTHYEAHGGRAKGRGVVQASDTFDNAETAAQWVIEHNNVMLELLKTLPAEVEDFNKLLVLANEIEDVNVIRLTHTYQVKVGFDSAEKVKKFLEFLRDSKIMESTE